MGSFNPRENNKKSILQSVSLNILTSPSQLLSAQSFAVTVTPKILLLSGDYLIIDIPRLYIFAGTIVTVTSTSNLSLMAGQSLCV